MRGWPLAFALLSALALPALGQAQKPSPPPPAPPPPAASPAPQAPKAEPAKGEGTELERIRRMVEEEVTPAPNAYVYNSGNRRDPFVSLIRPVEGRKGPDVHVPGMPGLLIQEIALKGIVKAPEGRIAMLLASDGKTYFAKVGQKFYDGEIVAMDAATVTFRQEVTDPLSPVKTREFKKTLYPSEEARQ